MTEAEAAIVLERVTVVRGRREVVRAVSATIPRGGVTGLVGPSGSGKTSLMRAIVGVQRHVGGRVVVLGRTAGDPSLRGEVAYLTQSPAVYADVSARENLEFFRAALGVARNEVERVVHAVDLDAVVDQPVVTMSGGERTRVALATALLGSPQLLVLDEPTVGLDPVLRADLWSMFHRLAGDGATLLVSSHVMDEAARCDELLLLRNGELLTQERPADILARTGTDDLDAAFLRLVGAS